VTLDEDEVERINIIRAAQDLHKFPHEVMRDLFGYPKAYCEPSTWLSVAYTDVRRADAEIEKFREAKARQKAAARRLRRR